VCLGKPGILNLFSELGAVFEAFLFEPELKPLGWGESGGYAREAERSGSE
jgi:hypothetical protein